MSLSSAHAAPFAKAGGALRVPLQASTRWTTVVVDLFGARGGRVGNRPCSRRARFPLTTPAGGGIRFGR